MRNEVASRELPEGFVAYTFHQTAGRGQRGNQWFDEPNANLAFSILLKPTFLRASHQAWLNKSMAVATRNALQSFTDQAVQIKWPNDILVDEQKVAGILSEVSVKGNVLQQAIIGIGVNVNNTGFPPVLTRATSLRMVVGQEIEMETVIGKLCEDIEVQYNLVREGAFPAINHAYHDNLYLKGAYQLFEASDQTFVAAIRKVDNEGRLVLKTPNGMQTYPHGSVRYRLQGFT